MELQEMNQQLKQTREELLTILSGLRGEQLNKRRDPLSWNISQICEHLSKTEELYIIAINRGLKSTKDSFIEIKPLELLLDRNTKINAPDIAKPKDELLECEEIIDRLNRSREKLNETLSAIEDPSVLSRRYYKHPFFKEMLLIQWVESLFLHEQRHIAQINEILECE
ncbi:DinB family protein [Paenibacillus sp. EC2-1]|uniref:DinB family protein n=1 Tax=Paenibacillus sp. EC2-1 TaxID=3388665 RepID=UPI003BEEDFFE